MKPKAFTIMEMVVNLAVMSIIGAVIFFIFSSLGQQLFDLQKIGEHNFRTSSFVLRLREDSFTCAQIKRVSKDQFDMVFYDGKIVSYVFDAPFLKRYQEGVVDSLMVKRPNYFLATDSLTEEATVKKINLTILERNMPYELSFGKDVGITNKFRYGN